MRMVRLSSAAVLVAAAALASCRSAGRCPHNAPGAGAGGAAPVACVGAADGAQPGASGAPDAGAPRALRRCFGEEPVWNDAPLDRLLDRAAKLFEAEDFEGTLACAEEASRSASRSVEAHHDRAAALARLGRLDEARDAISLALSLNPDDPETLEAAADLYINQLAPSADRTSVGLEFVRRAIKKSAARDAQRRARLALLEGQGLIDLGRAGEALRSLDRSLALAPDDHSAEYERGVALFDLCRFTDARRALAQVLARDAEHAHALYHLALIDEREGRDGDAARHMAEAQRLDPKAFPPVPDISGERFAQLVKQTVGSLPADVRRDLKGIPIEAADLPALDDLIAEQPPLSPTILGLFRGLPLGYEAPPRAAQASAGRGKAPAQATEPSTEAKNKTAPGTATGPLKGCPIPERGIALYRRNLLRSVRTEAELVDAIERTLLHEVGHLRGEDDGSLRARGLD